MHAAIAEHPADPICLFLPGALGGARTATHRAQRAGHTTITVGNYGWLPVVATVWPAPIARDFHEWGSRPEFAGQRSDDAMAGRYARHKHLAVWATVPSLVQHPDRVPSLIGKKHRAGQDRGRVAIAYDG